MNVKNVCFNGKEIKYIVFGSGARTMVIIPGISLFPVSLSSDSIEEAFKDFKKEYTIYLFDRNTFVPEGYTVTDFTNDLAYVLELLNIRNADFYTTSQGGMMALELAIYYPNLVNKIVLGSSAAYVYPETKAIMDKWIEYIDNEEYQKLNDSFWGKLFTEEYIEKYHDVFPNLFNGATKDDFIRFKRQILACYTIDLRNSISKINKPIFVMASQNDTIFGKEAFTELVNLTGAVGFLFDNYYHAVYDEAPEYRRYAYSFLVNGFKK